MVNSDVPHNGNLVSELHRTELPVQVQILSSVRSSRHMMAPLCERITNLFGSTPAASMVKIVQPQSALNDDYSNVSRKVKHVLRFRANN